MTERPQVLTGVTIRGVVGCGNIYGTVNTDDDGNVIEIFVQVGKSGQCARVQTAAICKVISHALRTGASSDRIMRDCLGETCDRWDGSPVHPRSCVDFIGRLIGYTLGVFDAELKPVEGGADANTTCGI